jgi:hypothetical protein
LYNIPNWGNYTKKPQYIPNAHKMVIIKPKNSTPCLPKYIKTGIFGWKIYHLATWSKSFFQSRETIEKEGVAMYLCT